MVLEILYPKPKSGIQPDSLTVDIVAVHGLNGDPTDTWKAAACTDFWLKDFLPHDVQGARVFTFGYNADIAFGNTTASIKDHALDLLGSLIDEREDDSETERPIIFIAHSLGGIVVKQALIWAHTEPRYGMIKTCTKGVVFFGTPHQGSDKANYGRILANIATSVMRKPSPKLIDALQTNSDVLEDLTSRFRFQTLDYHILSFYETKPMKMFSTPIVERRSALLESPEEDQQPVNANHREMCKFTSRDDQAYQKLVKRLVRMLKQERKSQISSSDPKTYKVRNEHYEVPHNVSPVFTGRADVAQELQENCLPTLPVHAQNIQKRFVLHGLGGSGKTQICLKFAQDHREKFWGIFFIDASSSTTAEQAFINLAQTFKVGERMQNFMEFLKHSLNPWLLILDNADDPSLHASDFFPVGNRGTILITTRNPDCTFHATVGSRQIGEMGSEEAITLLLKTSNHSINDEYLRGLALPIVQVLGHLALAIIHAGASIRQNICSLRDYLEHYEQHRKKLLSSMPLQAGANYKYTVYTTWEISLNSLQEVALEANNDDHTAANALDLLKVFAFFHFDDISEDIVENAWRRFEVTDKFPWWQSNQLRMIRAERSEYWDPLPFRQATQLLASYSLIRLDGSDNRISLHPLVHSWVRDSLNAEAKLRWWNVTISTLALASGSSRRRLQRPLAIHVRHCLGIWQLDDLLIEDDVPSDRIMVTCHIAFVYSSNFQWNDALMILERSLQYSRKKLGDECKLTFELVYQLAYIYNKKCDYQKACDLLQDMVDGCIQVCGGSDWMSLQLLQELSCAYRSLFRAPEALELAQKSVALCEASVGDGASYYVRALQELALVYYSVGWHEKAVALSEKVVDKRKETEAEDSSELLYSECYLARAYRGSKKYESALKIYKRILKTGLEVMGETHLFTLRIMVDMGHLYGCMNHPEKGIPFISRALDIGTRAGIDDGDLKRWEEWLAWLEDLCTDASTTGDQKLIEPPISHHAKSQDASSRRPWKFWHKNQRRRAGSPS